jgi:hypothetical protein
MRRWAMVSTLRQIGMKRPKWPRTLMSISASVGAQLRQRFCQRCGAGLPLAPPKMGQNDKSRTTGPPLASKQTQCAGLGCQNLEPYLCSCDEFLGGGPWPMEDCASSLQCF